MPKKNLAIVGFNDKFRMCGTLFHELAAQKRNKTCVCCMVLSPLPSCLHHPHAFSNLHFMP
jgi:hypothetical protein